LSAQVRVEVLPSAGAAAAVQAVIYTQTTLIYQREH
jgi:hypothetical protein